MGELQRILWQNKTSINVYSENLFIDKNFFKVLGKAKMLANTPNGIAGRKFGQGLPPVSATLKKMSENGRDSNSKFKKIDKKRQFFQDFSSNFHTRPLYRRNRQPSAILQSCAEALRGTHREIWAKKCQKTAKTPILGPKIVNLVNKKCFNQKTSAGTSSYIIIWWPHAKFEANRMVQL